MRNKIMELNDWQRDRYSSWLKFYRKEFNNLREFREFTVKCLDRKDNRPNLILNTGERLIGLADKIDKLIKGRPSFQIFFLIVCAEAIIRIIKNLPHERNFSEKSAIEFCNKYFSDTDKKFFERFFKRISSIRYYSEDASFSFEEIIRYFYRIRCEVAHQGLYWNFSWAKEDANLIQSIEYQDCQKNIIRDIIEIKAGTNYEKIRPIFLRAIINATQKIVLTPISTKS